MATSTTPNLSLRISSELNDDIIYNFRRIDDLGTLYRTNVRGDALIQSKTDIKIEPAAPSVGGAGSGGTIALGAVDNVASSVTLYASAIDFQNATLQNFSVTWDDISDFSTASVLDIPDFSAQVAGNASVSANTTHRGRTDNPHGVTAAQVSAYTTTQVDSLIAPLATSAALTSHTSATEAHGATGAVVGTTNTQTLLNKTISTATNTISGLSESNFSGATQLPYTYLDLTGTLQVADLAAGFSLPWTSLSKSGASLADLPTRSHNDLTDKGTNSHASIDSHLAASSSVHGVTSPIVGTSDTQTLTNKEIDADLNTLTNVSNTNIKAGAAIEGTKIVPSFGNQEILTYDAIAWEEGGFKTRLVAAQSGQVTDIEWELPPADGTAGQALITNGSGRFQWQSIVGSSLNATEVDIGSPGNVRTPVDTSLVGDILASTANGLEIKAGSIDGTHVSALTTDDISEGITNLYWTTARFDTQLATKTTTDLAEGANLYWTQGRFDTAFGLKSTTDLSEGTNLYWTQGRFDTALAASDTDDVAEGLTNLYFTDARARTAAVADSITDAVTTIAPSQNAVFDALALKQDLDSDLTALAGLTGTGLVTRTGAATYVERSIGATDATISVTNGDGVAGAPTIAAVPGAIDHNSLLNYVANEHIDHTSVLIGTGADSGLTGGGDLTATRNLSVDIAGTTGGTVAGSDELLISQAGTLRKTTAADIAALAAGTAITAVSWVTGDGTTKVAAHSFGTRNVIVEVMDSTTYETILVDTIQRTGDNQVTLTASEAPPAGGWTILIRN